jgi:hypothetical protein
MKGRALRLLVCLFAGVMSLSPAPAGAAPPAQLTLAQDFQADAKESAQKGLPILILYSLPGCPSCEVVRRSHLLPMLKDGKAQVIVRQVDLNSPKALKDFDGRVTTHGEYAQGQGIRFAPIVKLVGPDGSELATPLTGTLLPDFYAAYLDDAIDAARAKLKAAS